MWEFANQHDGTAALIVLILAVMIVRIVAHLKGTARNEDE